MSGETERRKVRSDDPALSDEANELLTAELREAVGSDEVEVPAGTPSAGTTRESGGRFAAMIVANRVLLLVSLAALVVIGGIASMAADNWLFLLLAVALHAVGTVIVAFGALRMTTETEHVAPDVAARLEDQGVANPDRVLTEKIEEYKGGQERSALTPQDDEGAAGAGRDLPAGAPDTVPLHRAPTSGALALALVVAVAVAAFTVVILVLADLI